MSRTIANTDNETVHLLHATRCTYGLYVEIVDADGKYYVLMPANPDALGVLDMHQYVGLKTADCSEPDYAQRLLRQIRRLLSASRHEKHRSSLAVMLRTAAAEFPQQAAHEATGHTWLIPLLPACALRLLPEHLTETHCAL